MPPPRLYVLPARSAPVAVVLRRGPTDWCQVLRWDVLEGRVERGAWLHGTLYPRRCDVSPDGRLLCYFALTSRPPPWDTYVAVSKVPWLTALAAWRIGSTWTPPCQFHPDGALGVGIAEHDPPDHGSLPLPRRPLTPYPPAQASPFALGDVANELRRGWELDESEPDAVLAIRRPSPADPSVMLVMAHRGHVSAGHAIAGVEARYRLEQAGGAAPLEDVTWADWDGNGRLMAATDSGALELREPDGGAGRVVWAEHLAGDAPEPAPPPGWATHW
jgi:hypothetical protein